MGEFSAAAVMIAFIGFLAFVVWASLTGGSSLEAEAIQRGYALHCPQTGDFAWKGECND